MVEMRLVAVMHVRNSYFECERCMTQAFVQAWVEACAAAGPALHLAGAASASHMVQILYSSLAAAARVVLELRGEDDKPTPFEVHPPSHQTSPDQDINVPALICGRFVVAMDANGVRGLPRRSCYSVASVRARVCVCVACVCLP